MLKYSLCTRKTVSTPSFYLFYLGKKVKGSSKVENNKENTLNKSCLEAL